MTRSDLEQAIRERVAERAEEWFPGVGPRPDVRLRALVQRPRAALYVVYVGPASEVPLAMAKVRRVSAVEESGRFPGTRPRLVPFPLPAVEQAALEYSGLCAIQGMIDPADPQFRALRPLDHLVDVNTLLMEYVAAPTLKQLLVREHRFSPRRAAAPRRSSDETWHRVGAWLRLFQQRMPTTGLPSRQATRQDIAERFAAYESFFAPRRGASLFAAAAARGADLASRALPERLPMAVGHGDFAPRNVFLHADGRITVLDPLPRWVVPRLEDVCRFLVAGRLQGLQVHTGGAAYRPAELDHRERLVLGGFSGGEDVDPVQLGCIQLLITLDTWSALVDSPAGGRLGGLRRAAVRRASGYVGRETERLLRLAESGTS